MASFLVNQIKPSLNEALDKAKAAAPALIETTLKKAETAVNGSVADANALFARLYADLAGRLGAWLPTTKPNVTTKVDGFIVWAKAKVKAL